MDSSDIFGIWLRFSFVQSKMARRITSSSFGAIIMFLAVYNCTLVNKRIHIYSSELCIFYCVLQESMWFYTCKRNEFFILCANKYWTTFIQLQGQHCKVLSVSSREHEENGSCMESCSVTVKFILKYLSSKHILHSIKYQEISIFISNLSVLLEGPALGRTQ